MTLYERRKYQFVEEADYKRAYTLAGSLALPHGPLRRNYKLAQSVMFVEGIGKRLDRFEREAINWVRFR